MTAEVIFNKNNEQCPIEIELKGGRFFFTKKGAIELFKI